MAEEKNGMAKGLFIGFLIGGAVGAITALLYAPKSGKELRSEIKRKAGDLADDASEYVQTVRTKTSDMLNEGKSRSQQVINDAKQKADNLLGNAEKVLTDIRQRASEEPGRVKSAVRAGVDAYKSEKEHPRSPIS